MFCTTREAQREPNLSKHEFFKGSVELLDHIVDYKNFGRYQNVTNIRYAAIIQITTSLTSLFGICEYYRRFIKGFAHRSAELYKATSKGATFNWTKEIREAFDSFKLKIKAAHVLVFSNFETPSIVETDVLPIAVGAVLSQKHGDRKL